MAQKAITDHIQYLILSQDKTKSIWSEKKIGKNLHHLAGLILAHQRWCSALGHPCQTCWMMRLSYPHILGCIVRIVK